MIAPSNPAEPHPTSAYVAHHAKERPDETAIIDGEQSWTFAEFDREIRRMAARLRPFPLSPRDLVAVEWTNPFTHWSVLLALESLGLPSATYTKQEIPHAKYIFDEAKLVLMLPDSPVPKAAHVHTMTAAWLEVDDTSDAADEIADLVMDTAYPVRIIMGSGTTGFPKTMLINAEAQEYRIEQNIRRLSLNTETRYFSDMPFNVSAAFYRATSCLRAGGACIWDGARRVAEAVRYHRATHAALVVGSLAQTLRHLPGDYEKPARLTVQTFGGSISLELRALALNRMADTILESYGTNEVPAIADIGPDGSGDTGPDVTVETLDEDGQPCIGVAGTIRAKSPYMVSEYLNDADATAQKFRDGWFYPGDFGVMPEPGKLKVLGRNDDLLNVNGVKLHPAGTETRITEIDGIADCAVTSLFPENGEERICICIVLETGKAPSDVADRISSVLPPLIARASVVYVNQIPRTKTGKIRRQHLKKILPSAVLDMPEK